MSFSKCLSWSFLSLFFPHWLFCYTRFPSNSPSRWYSLRNTNQSPLKILKVMCLVQLLPPRCGLAQLTTTSAGQEGEEISKLVVREMTSFRLSLSQNSDIENGSHGKEGMECDGQEGCVLSWASLRLVFLSLCGTSLGLYLASAPGPSCSHVEYSVPIQVRHLRKRVSKSLIKALMSLKSTTYFTLVNK